jgi:hypothetical protein
MTFKISPGVSATNIDWDPIVPSEIYIVMQRSPIHYMVSFPVCAFTDKSLAEYAVEGTKARGVNAWIETCLFNKPKEEMFVEWDKQIAKDKLENDKEK